MRTPRLATPAGGSTTPSGSLDRTMKWTRVAGASAAAVGAVSPTT